MSIIWKKSFVGAVATALALAAGMTSSSVLAAPRAPVNGAAPSPYYGEEGGRNYTALYDMYGSRDNVADEAARNGIAYDRWGNCIGWKCDF